MWTTHRLGLSAREATLGSGQHALNAAVMLGQCLSVLCLAAPATSFSGNATRWMWLLQRLAQPLAFFLQTTLTVEGLPCKTVLHSLTAIAGETLQDQVRTDLSRVQHPQRKKMTLVRPRATKSSGPVLQLAASACLRFDWPAIDPHLGCSPWANANQHTLEHPGVSPRLSGSGSP